MNAPSYPSAPASSATAAVPLRHVRLGGAGCYHAEDRPDVVAVESPLTLRVEGRAVAVVMRTPGHDRELAAGFLLTEGVIGSAGEVFEISVCPSLKAGNAASGGGCDPGDSVDVVLTNPTTFDPDKLTRHVFTSSSCGICSKTDLTTAIPPERVLPVGEQPLLKAEDLSGLPELLRASQPAFAATGGLHACAWWDAAGRILAPGFLFEDVGRHNALDKLLGHALLTRRLPLGHGVLVLSGRISFELVQKAYAAGIPVIAAVGAPSSLAVDFALAAGITLCGFVRENRFNIYTHPERIGGDF